eukprot:CAMPEP_0119558490 /NCGR_PEP_ID=MMETSP1352-20130426/10819_1 /TAXON_ID=265584 /ORGANISM="Stauroneis constricta, Strain CCMP1120" /LENGTH=1070 /DNA_ID=CAMNT_0007605863 /DNA_START=207 /DNA_END=3419 /DNA_ORIENTATION=-
MSQSNAARPAVATATGLVAMLQEPSVQVKSKVLEKLLACVDTLWHEVAESLADLESLAEDAEMTKEVRQTAAAVASRVFFHLEEPTQALRLALDAGEKHFNFQIKTPYVERLITAALDAYIQERRKEVDGDEAKSGDDEDGTGIPTDQLQGMVYRLLDQCIEEGNFKHAIGIALEAHEPTKLKDILVASKSDSSMLTYALESSVSLVSSKALRQESLNIIADCLKEKLPTESAAAVDLVLVYQILGKADLVASVFVDLMQSENTDNGLLALQLCFDLVDSGDQAFITSVAKQLKEAKPEEDNSGCWAQIEKVMTGGFTSELALSFLHKQSNADLLIMETLKKSMEERGSGGRNSILHNAAVVTHSYLHAGTTNDSFLRDHLDWMKKASNWAKFSATASLGVVHAGHLSEAMHLLQPYLPANPSAEGEGGVSTTGGFAEGGSLYALGLIHGSHSGSSVEKLKETSDYLRTHLRASHANEVISHGAALGVGLTSMGTGKLSVVAELKELLDTDSAVAGEAAGIAMGMVLVGTGAGNTNNMLPPGDKEEIMELIAELKNYARETQHEKIIRGISMGLALMQYGQEENADAFIEEMRSDRDPILRYGAQYALALAYIGTGSNKAIRILLHTAVSDVNDDVRMAAVLGLAFVLYKTPERVPQLVKLLLESFNPHVRYASCMAVGIAMAGTGDSASISLLEPMLDDMTDYVRQGAILATSMIYMQQSDTCNGRKIKSFRERLSNIVSEKHQSILTKMGAIMATGIIDAGGRNCSLILGSRTGFTKLSTAVGLVLWLQHWHWFPMMHMFSMALTPTFTIGLNKDFKYPKKYEVQCNSKPSVFAYPKKLEEKKEEKRKRVETVALSTTAKEKARLARKKAKEGGAAMDVEQDDAKMTDAEGSTAAASGDKDAAETTDAAKSEKAEDADDKMDVEKKEGEEKDEKEKKKRKKREPEPTEFRLNNPSRVTVAQAALCTYDLTQRYVPIRPNTSPLGVLILKDTTPGEKEELGMIKPPSLQPEGETSPPEPFEWAPPTEEEDAEMEEAKTEEDGGESNKEETPKEETKETGDAAETEEGEA